MKTAGIQRPPSRAIPKAPSESNGNGMRPADLARTGLPLDGVKETLALVGTVILSLDGVPKRPNGPSDTQDEVSIGDRIADHAILSPEQELGRAALEALVEQASRSKLQAQVVIAYVLDGKKQIEIAGEFEMTQMMVSRNIADWRTRARSVLSEFFDIQ